MSEIVIERPHESVVRIRIARPKQLNALNDAAVLAIVETLERCAADGRTRAAVVAGDARAFAAGADIGELASGGVPNLALWDRFWAIPFPIVAAVRGLALGGGLELAMSCDLLVVAEDARLGQPEIRLGLIPGAGGTQRLTHALGKALAMEMLLLGREIDGREAAARGLATRCVPTERVEAVALDLATAIAAQAPIAARAAKRAVLDAFEGSLSAGLASERRAFTDLVTTNDGREGVAAFIAKRAAHWSGT